MSVKLLLLILALTLVSATGTAQDYRPAEKDLTWGVESAGLRMAVWTNPAAHTAFVAVRNFSTKKICYCNSGLNNWTVYARKNAASEWQELTFKTPPQEVIFLPVCNIVNLKPNEEMPSYMLRDTARKKKDYSFSVDLREYSFPADWNGTVEGKIVQHNVYCNETGNKIGEAESQTFAIKLPFSETAAQR